MNGLCGVVCAAPVSSSGGAFEITGGVSSGGTTTRGGGGGGGGAVGRNGSATLPAGLPMKRLPTVDARVSRPLQVLVRALLSAMVLLRIVSMASLTWLGAACGSWRPSRGE